MWKESLGLIVVMALTAPVSGVEQEIINEEEYKTFCGFFGLIQRINSSLEIKEKSGVSVASLQKKVNNILFGANVDDVSNMKWEFYRELDCGQDNPGRPTVAGRALVQDLICLCDGKEQNPSKDKLCYKENGGNHRSTSWRDPRGHGNTWIRLRNGCRTKRREGAPREDDFKEMKKQLRTRLKTRSDATEGAYYTYGGHKDSGLHTCRGTPTETDGICVMYPRVSHQDNTRGIKWLSELEDLVETVEEMSKNANTDADTAATTTTKPITHTETDTNTNTQTKRSPGENSPAKGSDEPQKNGNPNARTTTSATAAETTGTTRPPEEQKSFVKIISQSLWIFLFLLFV
ncbi:Trypanosomal VSG domain containing protein [Trypanosoma brucei equiperdum]|uniref:Trypanosomal VSG domain containing protein n=1 Tax=Trypanosoma brucei equiperdum TaxID=630700 RepID=A0A3L6L2Y0_9TRYP|nr:Trypanosomal VSG domain containing protein [Trypanosoma brucei equiperdum]